jgi:flagellar biosynthetic protein FliR
MGDFANFLPATHALLLAFARCTGFMAFAPILGARTVPQLVKVMLALALASMIAPNLQVHPSQAFLDWAWLIALETSIGAAMGLAASLLFEIIGFAGSLVDYQVGFGFINVVDPLFGLNVSILSFLYNFLAMVVFLQLNGHHVLIEVFTRSYDLIGLASFSFQTSAIEQMVRQTSSIFELGFRLAAPMTCVMLLLDFSFGMLGKTVPQFQILVIGFPLKVGIGLLALGLSLGPMVSFMMRLFSGLRENLLTLMASWG